MKIPLKIIGNKWVKVGCVIFYIISLVVIMIFSYRKPAYNWDMLGYMALVLKKEQSDVNLIHNRTYAEAKQNIPAKEYEYLLGGPKRKLRAENATAFYNTLPFYAVKPLYIEMVTMFHKAGFSLPVATILPSLFSYFITGLFLLFWLSRFLRFHWALLFSFTIMYSGLLVSLSRTSTPDFLSALLLLVSFYFILEKPSFRWLVFTLVLAIATRIDNILACVMIMSFLFFGKKWAKSISVSQYVSSLLLFIVAYFLITYLSISSFGWSVFYYPSFALHLDLSGAGHSSFPVKEYFSLMYTQLITGIVHYNFMILLLLFFLILYLRPPLVNGLPFAQSFSVLLMGIVLVRFVLYPDLADRFHVSYFLVFVIIILKELSKIITQHYFEAKGSDNTHISHR